VSVQETKMKTDQFIWQYSTEY